ncbi:MAG: hypothetical protein JJE49_00080 [Peptostreptococcaceae bacterium]|nr:hypothetical protein [Peptostreptococcaceae bacterium]
MEITLSLKDMGILLIGIGLIVLLMYSIVFVKNLIQTIKVTNKILEDSKVITSIAADRAKEIDSIVGDVSVSVGSITESIKGNQSALKALSTIVNTFGAIKSLFNKEK